MPLFLTNPHDTRHVVRSSRNGNAPDCGGGNGGRDIRWQLDIGPANCAACQRIAARRARPVGLATYFPFPTVPFPTVNH